MGVLFFSQPLPGGAKNWLKGSRRSRENVLLRFCLRAHGGLAHLPINGLNEKGALCSRLKINNLQMLFSVAFSRLQWLLRFSLPTANAVFLWKTLSQKVTLTCANLRQSPRA